MTGAAAVDQVLGVYDADGGLRGEVAYVVGHLLGRRECALCDITHSPVRRKAAWDRMVAALPVPVKVVHRNEVPAHLREAVLGHELPAVFGIRGQQVRLLLAPAELGALEGSVPGFESALRAAAQLPPVAPR